MKKNRVYRTILAACAALLLSGCFKIRITMNVTKDATADGSMEVLFSESLLSMYGADLEAGIDTLEEQYKEQFPDAQIVRSDMVHGAEHAMQHMVNAVVLPPALNAEHVPRLGHDADRRLVPGCARTD